MHRDDVDVPPLFFFSPGSLCISFRSRRARMLAVLIESVAPRDPQGLHLLLVAFDGRIHQARAVRDCGIIHSNRTPRLNARVAHGGAQVQIGGQILARRSVSWAVLSSISALPPGTKSTLCTQ
jgi:hypothetical protein